MDRSEYCRIPRPVTNGGSERSPGRLSDETWGWNIPSLAVLVDNLRNSGGGQNTSFHIDNISANYAKDYSSGGASIRLVQDPGLQYTRVRKSFTNHTPNSRWRSIWKVPLCSGKPLKITKSGGRRNTPGQHHRLEYLSLHGHENEPWAIAVAASPRWPGPSRYSHLDAKLIGRFDYPR